MSRSYKREPVGAASSRDRGGCHIDKPESKFQKACDAIQNGDAVTRKHIKYSGIQTVLGSEEETSVLGLPFVCF